MIYELPAPSFVPIRYRPGSLGTWSGHLPFANDLVAATQPSLLVELGTHWGESYFTFCQSIFQNGINCLCYAVDHWLGEPHAGFYGEEVYEDVQQFNETHYRGFSYLLRMGFDDAALQFADDSIDLLHIDGLHTYDAVSHDFHTWLPKVKPGGIVLFHDIAVRHADFGVWRLWDELQQEFSQTFTFHHWWGLGVLQKPGGSHARPPLLNLLFNGSSSQCEHLRRHYVMCAAYLENTRGIDERPKPTAASAIATGSAATQQTHVNVQIYWPGASGYSEDRSIVMQLELDQWESLVFALPNGTGDGPLRLDPSDSVSLIEIRTLTLKDEVTEAIIFSADSREAFASVQLSESAIQFNGHAPYSLFSCTPDPYIILPASAQHAGPVRLEICIRVRSKLTEFAAAFKSGQAQNDRPGSTSQASEIVRLEQACNTTSNQLAEAEKRAEQSESRALEAQAQAASAQFEIERLENLLASSGVNIRQESQRQIRMLQELLDAAEERARQQVSKVIVSPETEKQLQEAKEMLANERSIRLSMEQSRSWVLTEPLRKFMRTLKG